VPKTIEVDGYPGRCPDCKRKVFVIDTIDGRTLFDFKGKRHEKTCPKKKEQANGKA
jgi:hypothetical protein